MRQFLSIAKHRIHSCVCIQRMLCICVTEDSMLFLMYANRIKIDDNYNYLISKSIQLLRISITLKIT